ncbi:hypothetical protein H0O03_02190 [Candidatus Micrarchaeota archaeon]|nr:hypothetical protein [Candidatus Micrarchaeota archaeon]
MQFVYLIEGKDKKALDAILAAEPYEKTSFAMTGYTLKESKALGLTGGNYVLSFKTELPEVEAKLKERLKAVPSLKELAGDEKKKVLDQLEAEEANAGAGFGAIFG